MALLRRADGCGCGEIGRRTRFRFWRREAWGFKSLHPHHFENAGNSWLPERFAKNPKFEFRKKFLTFTFRFCSVLIAAFPALCDSERGLNGSSDRRAGGISSPFLLNGGR